MQKHAYLILAHSNFRQLRKLAELLDDPRNDIYIHVDKKAAFDPDSLAGACRHSSLKFVTKRRKVNWGGVSIMLSEMELLKESTSAGRYSYYHLISGMDLPIKDNDAIYGFFEKNNGKEFISYWEFNEETEMRVHYYTPFPESNRNFIMKFLNKQARNLQKKAGYRINDGIDFKYASQWFSITDGLARYILSKEDWAVRTFGHSYICDEIFAATIAWNSPYRENLYVSRPAGNKDVNESNMRYIDWNSSKSIRHPWTFRLDDYDRLMGIPHLWARKFDERIDSEIIDKIYNKLKAAK